MNQQRLFYWGGPTHQSYGIDPVLVTITDRWSGWCDPYYLRASTDSYAHGDFSEQTGVLPRRIGEPAASVSLSNRWMTAFPR